jgi:hypothetical protein
LEEISKTAGIETWGGGSNRTRGKASKLDIITMIGQETHTKALDIGNLNLSDLNKILKVAKSHKELIESEMPKGRLKHPYIQSLEKIFPTVKNLSKLSVSSLQELLGAFTR